MESIPRLEAAMKAHREAPRTRGMDTSGPMRAALAAADAVMFSDEGIERAVLFAHTAGGLSVDKAREVTSAVIAALKGAGDE